jgi:hypothetical protein
VGFDDEVAVLPMGVIAKLPEAHRVFVGAVTMGQQLVKQGGSFEQRRRIVQGLQGLIEFGDPNLHLVFDGLGILDAPVGEQIHSPIGRLDQGGLATGDDLLGGH